ncbi:hypothetical protein ACLOJK_020981 [Asimina triloba]
MRGEPSRNLTFISHQSRKQGSKTMALMQKRSALGFVMILVLVATLFLQLYAEDGISLSLSLSLSLKDASNHLSNTSFLAPIALDQVTAAAAAKAEEKHAVTVAPAPGRSHRNVAAGI